VPTLRQSFALRPLEIKHIFDFAIRLLRSGFIPMFLSTAIVQLPLALLTLPITLQLLSMMYEVQAIANRGEAFPDKDFWLSQLDLAVMALMMLFAALAYQVLLTPLGNLVCARLAVCRLVGDECSFADAWQFARKRYWPTQVAVALFLLPLLLAAVILLGLVLLMQWLGNDTGVLSVSLGGMFILTAGMLVMLLFFCIYFPALNGIVQAAEEPEGEGILAQGLHYLRRAASLTRPYFWRMLGFLLFLSFIISQISRALTSSVQLIVSLVQALIAGSSGKDVVQNIVFGTPSTWELGLMLVIASLFGLLFPPYWQCFKTLLYFDLRCRREAFDLERMLDLPGGAVAR
jgi:hypothetical protein